MNLKYNTPVRSFGALLTLGALLSFNTAFADDQTDQQPPVDSDTARVEILATDPIALIGSSSAAVTFIREGPTNSALSVQYSIGGSASNGVDYAAITNLVVIPAGYLAVDLVIDPAVNPANRGNKIVILTLETNANYNIPKKNHKRAVVTLVDDLFNDQPPTVTLISPTNNASYTLPAKVTITAEAADAEGTLARVNLYANDELIAKLTNSPFTFVWTNPPPGNYELFARAIDNVGKATLSAPVHITVTNVPTVVTLISPTNQQVFGASANIDISATAVNPSNAVSLIEVLGDGRLLGSFSNSPVSVTWSNVYPGLHTISVRATDEFGAVGRASVQVKVTNAPPVVSLTAPADGANLQVGDLVTVKANASDADGGIRYVSFWANQHYIGHSSTAPYSITWRPGHKGVYLLRAVAADLYGKSTVSAPVTVSVSK